ncbi:hypothetical protein DFQ30_010472 [Apophysomyces sp. BC1015]|nr:hypothetical protein DFQ30_010472 [Apophysomyces sp. BC1015]KAG0170652.1 hypothetical protein DFQ29_009171 [Apophysomyces sp. BC1021]
MQRQRERAKLETQKSCQSYAHSVLRTETASITNQLSSNNTTDAELIDKSDAEHDGTSSELLIGMADEQNTSTSNTATIPREDTSTSSGDAMIAPQDTFSNPEQDIDQLEDFRCSKKTSNGGPNSTTWIVAGVDLAERFTRYEKTAKELNKENPIKIGHSLHDILSLTGVLLLCPSQHSKMLVDHFGHSNLDKVTEASRTDTLDKKLDGEDGEFLKLSRAVNNLAKEIKSMEKDKRFKALDSAELQLQLLANDLHPVKKAIVKGIISA